VMHGLIYESKFWEKDSEWHEWVLREPNDIRLFPK
jgi:hypothetical protein